MRDAFGGAFMLRIMIVFFAIFICFMTVAISITKTVRIKDNIINILERSDSNLIQGRVEKYLESINYLYADQSLQLIKDDCHRRFNDSNTTLADSAKVFHVSSSSDLGICVVPIGTENEYYYKVYSYIVIDFPMFHLGTVIPFSGESRTIIR